MIIDHQRIATVTLDSGWSLVVDAAHGAAALLYDAVLTSPEGSEVYTLTLWPSLEAVRESITGFLRREGLEPTAVALWVSVEAELR